VADRDLAEKNDKISRAGWQAALAEARAARAEEKEACARLIEAEISMLGAGNTGLCWREHVESAIESIRSGGGK
jgi:hypothetical protein